ncbi:uncharacterized protein LOC125777158 isoform X1 [Bactrocera dorsalis]|uniref:Uncharacterized protein LOC125777158 isoform X1 n=1 Tax=Bactrocera dorsalis TaxID=27457 RepID=A0ABM3JDR1_BACDO|nr:uncharacterized protein LOC125777158 isoform X1 [Bactrocera dorsalis]
MLVKVKSGNVIKLIDINTDTRAKDVLDFICSKFGIAYNITIKFLNRDKVPIEEDQIVSTIKQFGSCSCFLLEILDKGDVLKDTIRSCLIPGEHLHLGNTYVCIKNSDLNFKFLEWFIEIKPFLHLLRLLPSFTLRSKENKQQRLNFESTINKFINFQNINTPKDDFKLNSKQPTIVASGKSKEEIVQYFILIDGKALHVPITYTFIEVFHLYFKSFYVFHIEFDPALSNFIKFFSKFIYKVEPNMKCSNRVLEIYMKFKSKIDAERSVI